jgi:hypothetical protein
MAKRIGFIGNSASFKPGVRENTGNAIHGHAARTMFQNGMAVSASVEDANIAALREKITHLGFVAATMMHMNKAPKYVEFHEKQADFIEKLGLPVTTFGFGCHAFLKDTVSAANVDPRTVRLLRVIADHADTVGVRGAFTADLCAKYGVKNVTVVGCQSAYIAGLMNTDNRALATTAARPVVNLSFSSDDREILRLAMASGAGVIGQGDHVEVDIAAGTITREAYVNAAPDTWNQATISTLFKEGKLDRGDYYDYVQTHFAKFFDVPSWRAYMAEKFDFCVGTRFHGNMVALQAGVPALWVEHDMRTKELCEHLALPSIKHADLPGIASMQDLAAQCNYDAYWAGLPARMQEFLAYLQGNGVRDLLMPNLAQGFEKISAEGARPV